MYFKIIYYCGSPKGMALNFMKLCAYVQVSLSSFPIHALVFIHLDGKSLKMEVKNPDTLEKFDELVIE